MASKKLIWGRISESDTCFDLYCKNQIEIDIPVLAQLIEEVERADSDIGIRYCRRAAKAFHVWLVNPQSTFPEIAYKRLHNWCITPREKARKSQCGQASLALWKALFCAVPQQTFTDCKQGYKIEPEKFKLWWNAQERCQKQP